MSFKLEIDGLAVEMIDYSVSESSSPLGAGDSSGAVGSFTATVPYPDKYVAAPTRHPFHTAVLKFGPQYYTGKDVRLSDSRKGFTLGSISTADVSEDGATITFSGSTSLSRLNVYGIQAQPFAGTLGAAMQYYFSLANITSDYLVDPRIENVQVVFPGWNGELWYYLKLALSSLDCDISLVSGVILVRPVRDRIAASNRDTARSFTSGGDTLAQSIEIYHYGSEWVANQLIYPPGGWSPEVEVYNVNAGETQEYTLELSASLASIQQPTMLEFVGEDYSSSSVYTIVANDGLPIPPAQWQAAGGSVQVSIGEDTQSLVLRMIGPQGLFTKDGEPATQFSLALGSDFTGNRYSTLRIIGTGVRFDKTKVTLPTGIPPSKTATEVGETIDNPFIGTWNQVYEMGTRAARRYAGPVMSLSGSVISLNRRGDSGQITAPSYDDVQNATPTGDYASVQTWYSSLGLTSYGSIREYWMKRFEDPDADQVFGNAQGARIYDRDSKRWYRIRDANPTPGGISFTADDDLLYDDMQGLQDGWNYAAVDYSRLGMTYFQDEMAGLVKYYG